MKQSIIVLGVFMFISASIMPVQAVSLGDYQSHTRNQNQFQFSCSNAQVRVSLCDAGMFRVQLAPDGNFRPDDHPDLITVRKYDWPAVQASVDETNEQLTITTSEIEIRIQKVPFRISVYRLSDGKFISGDDSETGMYWKEGEVGANRMEGENSDGRFGFGIIKDKKIPLLQDRANLSWKSNTTLKAPFFLNTAGYGLYLNTISEEDDTKKIQFDGDGGFKILSDLDYWFIHGPGFKKVLNRYSELTGRMNMYPKWAYGYIIMKRLPVPQEMMVDMATRLRKEKWPIDMIYLDYTWFGNDAKSGDLVWFTERYPNVPAMFDTLHSLKMKTGLITKKGPCPVENNDEAIGCWGNMIQTNVWGSDYGGESLLPDEFDTKGPLRTNIAALVHWEAWRRKQPGQRPFIMNRGGWGSHHYSTFFTGDIGHNVGNYKTSITHMQHLGLIGYVYTAHDLGGYTPRNSDRLDPDAYFEMKQENATRWIAALGAFQSIMFTHGFMQRDPWEWDEFSQQTLRKFLDIRYRMLPYIYTTAWQGEMEGTPMVRAMVLEHQNQEQAWNKEYQYYFGDNLLVAPATEWEPTDVDVWLPEGLWFNFFSETKYEGGGNITVHAEMDEIPVFAKEGAIIPIGPKMLYTDEKPLDPVTLEIYPTRTSSNSFLYEDDGNTRDYLSKDAWSITRYQLKNNGSNIMFQVLEPEYGNKGQFELPENRNYVLKFHHIANNPSEVTVNEGLFTERSSMQELLDGEGRGIFYDNQTKILYLKFEHFHFEQSDILLETEFAVGIKDGGTGLEKFRPELKFQDQRKFIVEGKGMMTVSVLTTDGKQIQRKSGRGKISTSLPKNTGLYVIKVEGGGHSFSLKRFVNGK